MKEKEGWCGGGAWWRPRQRENMGRGRRGKCIDDEYDDPTAAFTTLVRGCGEGRVGGGGWGGDKDDEVMHDMTDKRQATTSES